MYNLKSSAELKAIAKERSLGKYGTLVGASVILGIIRIFVLSITSSFVSGSGSSATFILGRLITLIVTILMGIFISGEAYLYMNLIYSQTINVSDIFFGFKQQPQKAVWLQGILVVVSTLMTLPMAVAINLLTSAGELDFTLISLALAIAGVGFILNYYVKIVFSQVFFLLHDFPDWSVKKILSTSIHLMKGKKLKYLYLNISFLPLYLLGIITLFVPLLWINVYVYATMAAFYQDLISSAAAPREETADGLN